MHLNSGFTLWAAGVQTDGQAHMGHPLAEVYEDIEQELEELGQPQFEDKLEALLGAAAAGADQASLDAIRAEVLRAIGAARCGRGR